MLLSFTSTAVIWRAGADAVGSGQDMSGAVRQGERQQQHTHHQEDLAQADRGGSAQADKRSSCITYHQFVVSDLARSCGVLVAGILARHNSFTKA